MTRGDRFVPFGCGTAAYACLLEVMSPHTFARSRRSRNFCAFGIVPILLAGCSSDEGVESGGQLNAASGGADGVPGTGGAPPGSGGELSGSGGELVGSGGAVAGVGGALPGTGGVPAAATGGNASGGAPAQTDPSTSTIIPDPSWDCGSPEGIVPPEMGGLVFQATLPTDEAIVMGVTPYGNRRVIGIQEGDFNGEAVSGRFLTGGIDFELSLTTGSVELEQVSMLEASDGALIYLRSCGVAAPNESAVRFIPDFEVANSSSLSWLNTGEFVGTREFDSVAREMKIAVYDVSGVTAPEQKIRLQDPSDVPNQPWECATSSGTQGATVFTEIVTLGSSLSVGESKRGNRNAIPITGGTVTGQFTGTVVPGGADYQLLSGGATLDARYTLRADDGEHLIVRNCGPGDALVPFFEARVDGAYNFFNEGKYLSSGPGAASGGVSITIYEAN